MVLLSIFLPDHKAHHALSLSAIGHCGFCFLLILSFQFRNKTLCHYQYKTQIWGDVRGAGINVWETTGKHPELEGANCGCGTRIPPFWCPPLGHVKPVKRKGLIRKSLSCVRRHNTDGPEQINTTIMTIRP